MKLSIIIPVYNEEKTINDVLLAVNNVKFAKFEKEIIVVDDGSKDNTNQKIKDFKKTFSKDQEKSFKFLIHKQNSGKGSAVKTGISHASGDYIVIQDADLEYNPQDIKKLLVPIQTAKAKVVYGTRLKRLPNLSRDERTPRFMLHYLGNKGLSLLTSLLYGHWVTDMETCYKVFPKNAIADIPLRARGFELEPELTAKLLKKGYNIVDIPISTNPRSYNEGKKLNTFRDGIKALWYLCKYRFVD